MILNESDLANAVIETAQTDLMKALAKWKEGHTIKAEKVCNSARCEILDILTFLRGEGIYAAISTFWFEAINMSPLQTPHIAAIVRRKRKEQDEFKARQEAAATGQTKRRSRAKRSCGGTADHRGASHPRYEVVAHYGETEVLQMVVDRERRMERD